MPHLMIAGYVLVMNKFFLNGKGEKCAYFYCAQKDRNKCRVSAKASAANKDVNADAKELVNVLDPLTERSVKIEKNEENAILSMSLMSYQGAHTEMCCKGSQSQVVYKPRSVHRNRSKPKGKISKNRPVNKSDHKCDLCEYTTTAASTLRQHYKVKHEGITYSCDQCDYQVKYQASLERHIKAVHEGKTYNCTLCDFKSTTSHHLKIHVEGEHEGITHDCEYCGKQFKQKVHLKTHVDGMHKGVTYACTFCSYVSRQKSHLNHHIKTIYQGNPHKCDICGVIYAHNGQLKQHKVKEHGDTSFKQKFNCDQCGFFTKEEIFLTRHIQRRHYTTESKKRTKNSRNKSRKCSIDPLPFKIEGNVFVEIVESKPIIEVTDDIDLKGELFVDARLDIK
jgi:hypothetical protein